VTGRWSVALATGVLFAGVAMGAIVVAGHYPRTGEPRLVFWLVDVLAAAVAVFAAARAARGQGQQSPSQRVGASMFVGFLFGVLALVVLFAVAFVSFAVLIVVGLHQHPAGGAF
jgi:hypothetical protein